MGFKDFLKRGTGLELVSGDSLSDNKQSGISVKQSSRGRKSNLGVSDGVTRGDDKILKQLELEVSKAIEKLEDIRDRLRVRRGF